MRSTLLLIALLLTACSPPVSTPGKPAPTPTPATVNINFTTAKNLTDANWSDLRIDFQLTDPDVVSTPLLFAVERNDARDLRTPVIIRKTATGWKIIELPALHHTDWVYAGESFQRGELWAIVDSTADSRGPGLYFLRSTDDGQSWSLPSALKPLTLNAEFVSFTLNQSGAGTAIVHQDDNTDATPRGLYAYATTDAGLTWTGPTFTPDDLVSSDLPNSQTFPENMKNIDPQIQFPNNTRPQNLTSPTATRQFFLPFQRRRPTRDN